MTTKTKTKGGLDTVTLSVQFVREENGAVVLFPLGTKRGKGAWSIRVNAEGVITEGNLERLHRLFKKGNLR